MMNGMMNAHALFSVIRIMQTTLTETASTQNTLSSFAVMLALKTSW